MDQITTEMHPEALATEVTPAALSQLRQRLFLALETTKGDSEAQALQAVAVEVFGVLYEAGIHVDMVELARFADDDHDRSQDLYAGSNGHGQWATRERPMMSLETHLALA